MVTDEAYALLRAGNATLREHRTQIQEELAHALQRIREREATKTPPPSFVKASAPVVVRQRARGGERLSTTEAGDARSRVG